MCFNNPTIYIIEYISWTIKYFMSVLFISLARLMIKPVTGRRNVEVSEL